MISLGFNFEAQKFPVPPILGDLLQELECSFTQLITWQEAMGRLIWIDKGWVKVFTDKSKNFLHF